MIKVCINNQKRILNLRNKKVFSNRIAILLVPIEKIVRSLENQGMCKIRNLKKRDVIPTGKAAWLNLSLQEIARRYNYILSNILNGNGSGYNRLQLHFICYLLQHSLVCTFMNKLKLNSRAKVFKIFRKLKVCKIS
jgi:hypothetical protein